MISYERAKELLGDKIQCPAAGDELATQAAAEGDFELAAAAQLIGSMCCLGHNRAERMQQAANRYWQQHAAESDD